MNAPTAPVWLESSLARSSGLRSVRPHEIGAAEKAVQRLRWLAWQRAVRDATAASDAA